MALGVRELIKQRVFERPVGSVSRLGLRFPWLRTLRLDSHCGRRVCLLYHLDGQVICRTCARLWYRAQRTSSNARKFLAMRKIRRKLGDYGQISLSQVPPKPPRMWRKTYARHLASLARIERSRYWPRARPARTDPR